MGEAAAHKCRYVLSSPADLISRLRPTATKTNPVTKSGISNQMASSPEVIRCSSIIQWTNNRSIEINRPTATRKPLTNETE